MDRHEIYNLNKIKFYSLILVMGMLFKLEVKEGVEGFKVSVNVFSRFLKYYKSTISYFS